jgi:hypothetical protein
MYAKIDRVSGIVPALSNSLIREPFGQVAENIDFENGAFTPITVDLEVSGFTLQNGVRRSIFLYDDDHWLEWSADFVSAVKSPVPQDATGRLYWTGEAYPKVGTDASMISGSVGYPAASWRLGIPAPEIAPTVSKSGTVDATQVPNEVSYVYTLVSVLGEEGPPSDPSTLLSVTDTETVAVSMPAIDVPSGNYNFGTGALKRIYRSNTGSQFTEYQFVAEVSIATTSYNDVLSSSFLGELLPSETWIGPPDDNTSLYPDGPLQGLTYISNGIMAGFAGRQVCLSVPYLPHAWPINYRYTLDEDIVGIGTTPNGLVAITTGRPVFLTGADPGSMTDVVVDFSEACINRASIVDMGSYIMYASPDGLCAIENAEGTVVSKNVISVKQWITDFKAATYRAFRHEGTYIALWTSGGTHGGWVYDPRSQEAAFSTLTYTTETRGGWHNAKTGVTYKIIGNKIWAHRQGTATKTGRWKSKKYIMPYPTCMSWLYVAAQAYPVTIKVYGDGIKLADYTLAKPSTVLQQTNNVVSPVTINLIEPLMRMPAIPATEWEIEIESTKVVDRVILAQTLDEIKSE